MNRSGECKPSIVSTSIFSKISSFQYSYIHKTWIEYLFQKFFVRKILVSKPESSLLRKDNICRNLKILETCKKNWPISKISQLRIEENFINVQSFLPVELYRNLEADIWCRSIAPWNTRSIQQTQKRNKRKNRYHTSWDIDQQKRHPCRCSILAHWWLTP